MAERKAETAYRRDHTAMSESNSINLDKYIRAGFLITALCLLAALIWQVSADKATNAERARKHATEYAGMVKQRISKDCVTADSRTNASECIAGLIEATREDQRAEYDLTAQQDMAKWALLMFWVTAFTAVVGFFGVIFVKRTLDATLTAVEQSSEATSAMVRQNEFTEQANRPWLDLLDFELTALHIQSGQVEIRGMCSLINFGKSIAKNVCVSVDVRQHGMDIIMNTAEFFQQNRIHGLLIASAALPNKIIKFPVGKLGPCRKEGGNSVTLIVKVDYVYGLDSTPGMTCKYYDIRRHDGAFLIANRIFDCATANIKERTGMERYE